MTSAYIFIGYGYLDSAAVDSHLPGVLNDMYDFVSKVGCTSSNYMELIEQGIRHCNDAFAVASELQRLRRLESRSLGMLTSSKEIRAKIKKLTDECSKLDYEIDNAAGVMMDFQALNVTLQQQAAEGNFELINIRLDNSNNAPTVAAIFWELPRDELFSMLTRFLRRDRALCRVTYIITAHGSMSKKELVTASRAQPTFGAIWRNDHEAVALARFIELGERIGLNQTYIVHACRGMVEEGTLVERELMQPRATFAKELILLYSTLEGRYTWSHFHGASHLIREFTSIMEQVPAALESCDTYQWICYLTQVFKAYVLSEKQRRNESNEPAMYLNDIVLHNGDLATIIDTAEYETSKTSRGKQGRAALKVEGRFSHQGALVIG